MATTFVATALAATQSITVAVVVFVLLLVYHAVEGHAIRPLMYGRSVALSPLTMLVALLLGYAIAGVLGVLVAIPVAGAIAAVAHELLAMRRA